MLSSRAQQATPYKRVTEAAAVLGTATRGQAGRDATRSAGVWRCVYFRRRSTLAVLIAEAGAKTVLPTSTASATFARERVSPAVSTVNQRQVPYSRWGCFWRCGSHKQRQQNMLAACECEHRRRREEERVASVNVVEVLCWCRGHARCRRLRGVWRRGARAKVHARFRVPSTGLFATQP